jgi:hypothetical protein
VANKSPSTAPHKTRPYLSLVTSPHRVGRPSGEGTYFRGEYVEQAHKLALLGWSSTQLAAFFGVTHEGIAHWKKRYPAFREAIDKGGPVADSEVAASFFQRAVGYDLPTEKIFCLKDGTIVRAPTIEHVPADTGAARAWLQGRQPELWSQRATLDVNVQVTDARERFLNLIEGVASRSSIEDSSKDE